MRIGIIANAHANRGRAGNLIEKLRNRIRASGFDVTLELTREAGDGRRLGAELATEMDVIGVFGGDGTVHEVINGLMPNPCPTFILPSGTGNDYASLVRGPKDLDDVLAILEAGMGARLDVLDLGNRFCVNSAGIGFEGEANRQSHKIRRLKGPLLYLVAVFKALSAMSYPVYRITAPGMEPIEGKFLMVSIGNGNRTGGTFYLTPDAKPDDGHIDVCLVEPLSKPRLLTLLPLTFKGAHVGRAEVRILRVPSLTIEATIPYAMHVDGEFVGDAPLRLDIRLLPRAMPILCMEDPANALSRPLERLI